MRISFLLATVACVAALSVLDTDSAGAAPPDRFCGNVGMGNEAHARGSPLAGCATTRRVLGKYLSTRRKRIENWTCHRGSYAVLVTCTHRRAQLILFDGSYGE